MDKLGWSWLRRWHPEKFHGRTLHTPSELLQVRGCLHLPSMGLRALEMPSELHQQKQPLCGWQMQQKMTFSQWHSNWALDM